MYVASSTFRRTAAERADQQLSWDRPDAAFFAAGACHILAFAVTRVHSGLALRALRKVGEPYAFHVFATTGLMAFDFAGWTPEEELIAVTASSEAPAALEVLDITTDLRSFCAEHNCRLPEDFAQDPWPRAAAFIKGFPRDCR